MQGPRYEAAVEGQDHLDDTGGPGGGLGVPDVGLDGADQQRPVLVAVTTVGRDERPRLDRVAQCGAGAVGLDDVDVGGGQPGVGQGLPDHAVLRRAVRRGQPVGGAVGVHGGAAHDGQDRVTVAAGVGQPFQDQDPDALSPAGAVGPVGEGLAPAVRRQSTLAAELDEDARGRGDGDTAGEGERALPRPQGLGREVHRDQRGGTGRVDGHRRPFETEGVGDPSGQHAGRAAGGDVAGDRVTGVDQQLAVVLAVGAGEDSRAAAAQRVGRDPRSFEGLPGGLQQQSLLGVHGQGLTRRDPEGERIELGGVVQETTPVHVGGPGVPWVGVVELVQVPAPVGGEPGDGVGALDDQPPQVVRAGDAAREPAAHPHDDDRVVAGTRGLARGVRRTRCRVAADQLGEQVIGELPGRRVVEHQRRGEGEPGRLGQPVAEFERGQGREPQVLERPGHRHVLGRVVPEQHRGLGADRVEHHPPSVGTGGRADAGRHDRLRPRRRARELRQLAHEGAGRGVRAGEPVPLPVGHHQ